MQVRVYIVVQTLAIVAEQEGGRRALVTPAKTRIDTFAPLSTAQHVSSSSKVHT